MTNIIDDCRLVTITELHTPKDGYVVYLNRWWVVDGDSVLFYCPNPQTSAPQCNASERITRHLQEKLYPGLSVRLIEVAYIPMEDCL